MNKGVSMTIPLPHILVMRDLATPFVLMIERQYSCICSPIADKGISVFLKIGGNSENLLTNFLFIGNFEKNL